MPTAAAAALNRISQTDLDDKSYALDLSNWGLTTLTSLAVDSVVKISDNTDVKAASMPGTPTVVGTTITTPLLGSLVLGEQYRIRITFVDSGNTHEANFIVDCRVD